MGPNPCEASDRDTSMMCRERGCRACSYRHLTKQRHRCRRRRYLLGLRDVAVIELGFLIAPSREAFSGLPREDIATIEARSAVDHHIVERVWLNRMPPRL